MDEPFLLPKLGTAPGGDGWREEIARYRVRPRPKPMFKSILDPKTLFSGGIANPTALILSAVLMLRYLGEKQAADRVEAAVRNVFVHGGQRRLGFTYDVAPHPDDTGRIEYAEIVLGPAR